MNIIKSKCKKISAILLLLVVVLTLTPISAFATGSAATAVITVENQISGSKPETPETFVFKLIPDDESYPMPEGENGDTLTITGANSGFFGTITYVKPEVYTYTAHEITGTAANYSYDKTVYKITVHVTTDDYGNLTAQLLLNKDDSPAKSEKIVFVNTYTNPIKPDDPQTGDMSNLTLWITLAGVSAATLLIITLSEHLRKKGLRRQ